MATTASRHSQRPSFLPWSPVSSGKTPAAPAAPRPAATPPSDPVRLPPSPATTPREANMATSVSASANGSGSVDAEATPKGAATARMSSSPTRNSFGPSLDGTSVPVAVPPPAPAPAARPTRARAGTSATVTSPSVRVRPPSASPDDTDAASDDDYHSAMPPLSTRPTTRSKRRPHHHQQRAQSPPKHRAVIAVPLVVLRARGMAPSADALVKIQAQYGGIPLPVRDEHLTLCLDVCAEMEKGDDLVEQAAAKAFLDHVYGSTQQTPDDVAGRVDALTAQVADLAAKLHVSWAGQELLRLRLEMLELKYDGAASGSNSTLGRGGLAHAHAHAHASGADRDSTLTDGPSNRSSLPPPRPDVAALAARVDMLDGVLNGLRSASTSASTSTSPPRPPTPTLFGFTPTRLPKVAPPKPRPSSLPVRAAPPPPGHSPLRQHVAHHYNNRDGYAHAHAYTNGNGNRHLYPSASDTDTDTDTMDTMDTVDSASHVSFGSLDIPAETPLPANLVIWVCTSCRLHNPDWEKGACQFCAAARPGSSGRASGQSTGESEDLDDIEEE